MIENKEIFGRTALLLGDETIGSLSKMRVAIMGLGGVGSYAAEALARSGVEKFLLVDFDTVSLSNINRQLIALHSSVGMQKTAAMSQRLKDINPHVEIDVYNDFCAMESRDFLLQDVDFVVDAIDSLGPKIGLLEDAYRKNIPTISSMGAASRRDPSQIKLADISESTICPLAKRVRKYLRRRDIDSGIPVVFSTEVPIAQYPHEAGTAQDAVSDRGRKRGTLASVCYMPAIMGMWVASYVIRVAAGDNPVYP